MQENTEALIHAPSKGSGSREVIISGRPGDVKIAKDLVNSFISSRKEIKLSDRQVRIIVGTKGATISSLAKSSGTQMKITDNTLMIYGTEEAQAKAISKTNALYMKTGVPTV